MEAALHDQLRALLDRQAIAELLYDYADAVDRRDAALAATLFTPDAQLHYGVMEAPAAKLVAMMADPRPSRFLLMHHLVGNIRIRFRGADRARSIAYVYAYHKAQHEGPGGRILDEMLRGRYLDTLVRQDGAWRFSGRTLVFDWSRTMPAQDTTWWDAGGERALTGTVVPGDPATGFLDAAD